MKRTVAVGIVFGIFSLLASEGRPLRTRNFGSDRHRPGLQQLLRRRSLGLYKKYGSMLS